MTKYLGAGNGPPVVLAGVSQIVAAYRAGTTSLRIVTESVSGNADMVSADELHAAARPLVEHHVLSAQNDAVKHCASLLATGHWSATADIAATLGSAHLNNVDTLFVATDAELWGTWNAEHTAVNIGKHRSPDHDDLLNVATVMVHRHGGKVHVLPRVQMPGQELVAALLRH